MRTLSIYIFLCTSPALAGEATVIKAIANEGTAGWRFDITISHTDTGWDHYADGWGVYTLDGRELGYRVLAHPHVNEQPFTRSLSGVEIPSDITEVIIRPHDLVHGNGPDFPIVLR